MDRNERRQLRVLAATAVWIVATWLAQFLLGGSVTTDVAANLIEAGSPAIAAMLCWSAGRRTARSAWYWMAAGCAMWTLGSFAWTFYVGVYRDAVPFPSLADMGYIAMFAPMIVGALLLHDTPPRGADRVRTLLDSLLVAGSLTVVLWWALLGAAHRGGNSFESLLSVAYVVGDIIVLSLVVGAFRRSSGRRHDLLVLTVGFGLLTAGDALFSFQEATNSYTGAWFPDLGWIGGFSFVGLAAVVAAYPSARPLRRRWVTTEGVRSGVLFGPYLGAVAVTTWDLIHKGRLGGTQAWTTIGLATVAFARQVAAQAERSELTRVLEDRVDQLTTSRARFFTVFDESIEALALLDASGRVQLTSHQLVALTDSSADELVGRPALAFVHPDDRADGEALQRRVSEGEHSGSVTVRVPAAAGTRHVELTFTNLLDNAAVGSLLLGCRDITERVHHEQELAASQSRFRAAFDNAPIGMVVIDADGTVNRLNSSLLAMLGGSDDQFLRSKFVDLAHPNDREIFERVAVPSVWVDGDVERGEARLLRTDGTIIWTTLSAVRIRSRDEPTYVIAQIEDVTERREIARTLEYNARHDPLTGLANRTLFMQKLTDAVRIAPGESAIAVAFVDIDRFKFVNDSLGHDAGDSLLCIVAERLLRVARDNDVVARFGGDEFTILLRDVSDTRVALAIAERLETSLRQPVVLGEVETYITVSVGIAMSQPLAAGVDPEEAAENLLRDSDTAMYQAKEAGRSRTELFDEHRDRGTNNNRLEIANALHRAIERDEFRVLYQPVVDATTGLTQGFEALVRWEREPGRLISPAEFIGVAEDTGLIVPIGAWVLRNACAQAARWWEESERGGRPPLTVSVNLSPRQLDSGDLVHAVARALDSSGLPADLLWLEITESALMRDTTSTITILRDLRRLGVHLSIDDFGTGYSSLSYLKRFPVEALKIDRSFTDGLGTEPEDTAIVTAVIGLAHALNLRAVAEGVETPAQLEHLRALGCDSAQGYLFGRPTSPDALGENPADLATGPAGVIHMGGGEPGGGRVGAG